MENSNAIFLYHFSSSQEQVQDQEDVKRSHKLNIFFINSRPHVLMSQFSFSLKVIEVALRTSALTIMWYPVLVPHRIGAPTPSELAEN